MGRKNRIKKKNNNLIHYNSIIIIIIINWFIVYTYKFNGNVWYAHNNADTVYIHARNTHIHTTLHCMGPKVALFASFFTHTPHVYIYLHAIAHIFRQENLFNLIVSSANHRHLRSFSWCFLLISWLSPQFIASTEFYLIESSISPIFMFNWSLQTDWIALLNALLSYAKKKKNKKKKGWTHERVFCSHIVGRLVLISPPRQETMKRQSHFALFFILFCMFFFEINISRENFSNFLLFSLSPSPVLHLLD